MIQNRSSRVITVLGGVLAIGILSNLFTMGSSAAQPLKIGDVVPDLVLQHEDGREAFVDIVWFWKKGSLERKLESLKHGAPPNLIFAVSDRLKTDEEEIQELPVSVLRFKGVLPSQKILESAEDVGV